jgi:hypothetical protein
MLHQAGQFRNQLILVNRFIFSETFCEKISFFADRGHLQASKVRDLKLLCLSQLRDLKDRIIKVGI